MTAWYRVTIAAVVLAGSLVAGCGSSESRRFAGGTGQGQVIPAGNSTDGLTITFASDPDPLSAGDNSLEVTVKQSDGAPVTDATVRMVFSMPAMPSMNMPAMRSDALLQHAADGRYRGTGQLPMGGTWNVAMTVARGAEELGTRWLSIVAKE